VALAKSIGEVSMAYRAAMAEKATTKYGRTRVE
jgi:hypothetical protein